MQGSLTGVVVVTGANRGIGLALCQIYRDAGANVVGACRQRSEALDALGVRVVEGVDIGTPEGRNLLVTALAADRILLLINNAGIWCDDALGDMDEGRLQHATLINATAPLLLTDALMPRMGEGSKIAFITSRMGSIADNGSGGRYGYRMSKAALNAGAKSMAIDLKSRGITVAILHPGFVQTRMVGFAGDVTTGQSAAGLVQRIAGLSIANTGTFWHAQGQVLPW